MIHRILVVDDEPEIVKILKMFLTKKGFEVITALGGEEAAELLRSDINVDLMVLDMKMPKISGISVLKKMKSLNKQWPVIILSGSIDIKKHKEELESLGIDQIEYFIKPLDLNLLLEVVNKKLNPNSSRDK